MPAFPVAALVLSTLVVAPSRIEFVATRSELAAFCGTDVRLVACTKFLGEKLWCECVRDGYSWAIKPKAQFIPYLYVWDAHAIPHEAHHIRHIREAAEAHLDTLGAARYESNAECERAAAAAAAAFSSRMDEWKRMSNRKLHPTSRQKRR